ncbi:MAG TPA: Spy/CpxP family protein refolding chaperone [Gemmataceae bacterium]|jgi:Spy/CpxP family protein refolding chaperone|nr:Spy/CpxP family protein refolding chaperone [Gemmataceae bacterium]
MSHPFRRGCGSRTARICHTHHHHPERGAEERAHRFWASPGDDMDDHDFGGFGVRRPLRFLAQRLDLDEKQMADLARILDELKTERAQAEVDRRRTLATFSDALAGATFDAAKAGEAGELRVASAGRVRDAVLKALGQIHAALNADQRVRLAYLIRTGVLTI